MVDVTNTNRIREVRLRKGLTMAELGDKVGVHFTTIAKVERAQRAASGDLIMKIANALDVPVTDLLANMPATVPARMIPIVGQIAAGNWREAVLDPSGYIAVPYQGERAFALRPDGDSMDLVVGENAYVVVDPDLTDLLDGKLYAIMNADGETTFKRFRGDPPRLEPVSSNPDHRPIPLGREPFTVVGRVVFQASQL